MFDEKTSYIKDLMTTLQKISKNYEKFEVVILADEAPVDTHSGRYIALSIDEVVLVIVGQQFEKRDIILQSMITSCVVSARCTVHTTPYNIHWYFAMVKTATPLIYPNVIQKQKLLLQKQYQH